MTTWPARNGRAATTAASASSGTEMIRRSARRATSAELTRLAPGNRAAIRDRLAADAPLAATVR
jgi:hypothetical protein